MGSAVLPHPQQKVSRLLERGWAVVTERLWSTVPGGCSFDGRALAFDGDAEALAELRMQTSAHKGDSDEFVIWAPNRQLQPGRIPRSLTPGFTLVMDGDEIVLFQSVVFMPFADIQQEIAATPSGRIVLVGFLRVSSWDGSSYDAPVPAAS